MTWTVERTADGHDVLDHDGEHVETVTGGLTVPDDVLDLMGRELDARNWDLSDPWVQETVKAALVEDVEVSGP